LELAVCWLFWRQKMVVVVVLKVTPLLLWLLLLLLPIRLLLVLQQPLLLAVQRSVPLTDDTPVWLGTFRRAVGASVVPCWAQHQRSGVLKDWGGRPGGCAAAATCCCCWSCWHRVIELLLLLLLLRMELVLLTLLPAQLLVQHGHSCFCSICICCSRFMVIVRLAHVRVLLLLLVYCRICITSAPHSAAA
jgi:hypothetical protein